MVFVTRLLSEHPEDLQGPLLADTYVTYAARVHFALPSHLTLACSFLKGRNAWYGERLGRGEFHPRDGDVVPGKGLIQGVSAVHAFCELLSNEQVKVFDKVTQQDVSAWRCKGGQ